jgi:hypothetical protein
MHFMAQQWIPKGISAPRPDMRTSCPRTQENRQLSHLKVGKHLLTDTFTYGLNPHLRHGLYAGYWTSC